MPRAPRAVLWLFSHSEQAAISWLEYHTRRAHDVRSSIASRRQRWRNSQNFRQKLSCKGFSAPRDVFRSPLRHNPAAARPSFGSQVDDVVRRLDDVEVVLDDDDRVALIDELVQDVEQLVRVGEVQSGRRLVEDVERRPVPRRDSSFDSLTRCASPPLSVVADCPSSM